MSVDLHRSDSLQWLNIWAPNLQTLGLQACYSLQRLDFLDVHPLQSALPANHQIPDLLVNTANANLSAQAKRSLRNHPTAIKEGQQHGGVPTEGMFASMFGSAAGGGDGDDGPDSDWGDEGESEDGDFDEDDFNEFTDDEEDTDEEEESEEGSGVEEVD